MNYESKLSKRAKRFLAVRKRAARYINADTAEICKVTVDVLDPYGVGIPYPPECKNIGRDLFLRAPRSKIWVWDGDLPAKTFEALQKRIRKMRDSDKNEYAKKKPCE